ncbi:hypothetical protein [Paenibacillus thalictri]|uniref:Uncharacterized protein n=1 Tax=Paenibacillus thalictri TaxID=2527873 RepID=A0A4Q9DH93_9BACL|nr:hypothetical protein [Paenibacillus thalictri]TBL70377.1 hypothetical protein EYB31_33185 [Paenibacillus thalictri]
MNLIQFLLQNWYLLLIIYAIYTVFRSKRKSGSGQPPRGGMPPFGGEPKPRVPLSSKRPTAAADRSAEARRPDAEQERTERPMILRQNTERPANRELRPNDASRSETRPMVAGQRPSSTRPSGASGTISADLTQRVPASGITDAFDVPESPLDGPAVSAQPSGSAAVPPLLTPNMAASRQIEGVMWAEILGPPRAKRPYRR